MNKFAMDHLYSYELHESLYLESEETVFVLHTERSEPVGTLDMLISGQPFCNIPETKHRLYAKVQAVFFSSNA